jgi:hypothetical protein
MASINSLQGILTSPEWKDLTQRLLEYVDNFEYKVVQARSGFQL